jgi:uncharacterized membrane protein YhaH (DUF805 family)
MRGTILDLNETEKSGIITTDGGRFTFEFEELKTPLRELHKGADVDFESDDNSSAKDIYIILKQENTNIPYYEDQPKGFASLFSAKGCFTRWQYWKVSLIIFVLYILYGFALGFVAAMTQNQEFSPEILGVFVLFAFLIVLPLIYINIVTSIKRFHDINLSGWFVLLNFIPYIGGLITLVMNGFLPSVKKANRFCQRREASGV